MSSTWKTRPTMVVPVLRNWGILAPCSSRRAFLGQRSKEKPPLPGASSCLRTSPSPWSFYCSRDKKPNPNYCCMPRHNTSVSDSVYSSSTSTCRRIQDFLGNMQVVDVPHGWSFSSSWWMHHFFFFFTFFLHALEVRIQAHWTNC